MLFIYFVKVFSDTLDDFINKPIKIYFSGYSNTFLGLNTKKNKMVANNKYVDFTNASFNPIAKLIKEGSTYEIYLAGKRMCRSGGNVIVCTSKGGWSLDRRPFGYTISKDNLCITKDSAEDVALKTCVNTDDQIFDFKNVTDPNDCGAKDVLEEKDDHKVNVNILTPQKTHRKSKIKVKNLGTEEVPEETLENDSYENSSEYQDLYDVLETFQNLDDILYKKIRIRSIPYSNYLISEKINDFGDNVFYTSNIDFIGPEDNVISLIEKKDDNYKIKIGNYFLCRNDTSTCKPYSDDDPNVCMNERNDIVDCLSCRNNTIHLCKDTITDVWEIEKKSLGYIIKKNNQCLTLGFKLFLSECVDSKDQLFGFEDYEIMSCIENINIHKKPESYKDILDKNKVMKNLKKLKKSNKKEYERILENLEAKKDFDKFIDKVLPSLKDKPASRKLWGSLWSNNFSRPKWNYGFPNMKMFCKKLF